MKRPDGRVPIVVNVEPELRATLRKQLHGYIRGWPLPLLLHWFSQQHPNLETLIMQHDDADFVTTWANTMAETTVRFGCRLFKLVDIGPAPVTFTEADEKFLAELGREIDAEHDEPMATA